MAETVHLFLKANGNDVKGESTQVSLGREGSIECLRFKDAVRTAREKGSGLATGRRSFEPLEFRKRIDASSPLLAQALTDNEVVEGEFQFFRPNPAGDGTTEHFFTITFKDGRLSSIERESPDVIDPAAASEPPTETVKIVFHTIRWTYLPTGAEAESSWSEGK